MNKFIYFISNGAGEEIRKVAVYADTIEDAYKQVCDGMSDSEKDMMLSIDLDEAKYI